jgi:hypothetical protein
VSEDVLIQLISTKSDFRSVASAVKINGLAARCNLSARQCNSIQGTAATIAVSVVSQGTSGPSTVVLGPLKKYSRRRGFHSDDELEMANGEWLRTNSQISTAMK